jgi:uncharacterized LabA/DUF88 family protein
MTETVYLFVDGGYLRSVYEQLFVPVWGDAFPIDYLQMKAHFQARRLFLYDCLDDAPKPGENPAATQARAQQQQEQLDAIDRLEGVHVCYGHLSRGRKRLQKEVDVALAVDMLTHCFSKNMTKAVLVAGDRDFRPLVESVVRLGTYVQVVSERRSTAAELALAADSEMGITIETLCAWAKLDQYQNRSVTFPIGTYYQNYSADPALQCHPGPKLLHKGFIGSPQFPIALYETPDLWTASVQVGQREYVLHGFRNEQNLVAHISKLYGDITWKE